MPTDAEPISIPWQQLHAVLQGVLDPLIVTNTQGSIVYMNPAANSLYGFERVASSQLTGRNLQHYFRETFHVTHEDGRPVPDEEQPFTRVLRGEPFQDVALRVRHKEKNEEKVFTFTGATVGGITPLNVLTVRDVTEHRKAERRYRISFETNPAPTLIVKLSNSVVVDANEGFRAMTGLTKEDTIGQSLMHLGLLPRQEDLRDAIDVLKEGRGIDQVQTTVDAPGRGRRSVLVSARPIEIETQPCGIFTFLDVTDLRLSEALVEKRTSELRESNEELDVFHYSVSHDLRTPLRAIDGFSQILLEKYEDAQDDEALLLLERVRAAANKMGRLIDALLRLSQLSHQELHQQNVDLSRTAREITDWLHDEEPERQVDTVIAPGVTVFGDQRLLRLMLEHLMKNAWKHTREQDDARIEFGVLEEPDTKGREVLFVRDNGTGFDMRYASRLFKPFGQLHSPDQFQGLGIGLSIVRRVIQRHAGHVWAASTPGQGASFYFTLGLDEQSC